MPKVSPFYVVIMPLIENIYGYKAKSIYPNWLQEIQAGMVMSVDKLQWIMVKSHKTRYMQISINS